MPKTSTFLFGRLNITWHGNSSKEEFIFEALSSDVFHSKGKFKYGLFDVRDIYFNNDKFAYGVLVKYKPSLEGEVVNEIKK